MSKKQKKNSKPNIAPAALLHVRLERLWHDPAAAHKDTTQLEAEFQAASEGVKPEIVVQVVLAVLPTAPAQVQAALEPVMPRWLARQNHLGALEALVASAHLPVVQQSPALRWLAAAGLDVSPIIASQQDTFHSAYELDDGSQAAVTVLYYSNPRRSRARGLQFLIDYNPPWDGAIKDAFQLPSKPPEKLVQRYVDIWQERGQSMTPLGGAEIKRKLLRALQANREANVRLPVDLVLLRDQFFQHILALPDLADTPAFSEDDFHALSTAGEPAEKLARYEQTVARRIRLEDGSEVYVDPSLAAEDFDDWEDDEA